MAGEDALKGIYVAKDSVIKVRGMVSGDEISSSEVLYMTYTDIVRDVPVGRRLLIDDGEIGLSVIDKNDSELICRVETTGEIMQRKSVNIPGVSISLPSVTERDRHFIEWARRQRCRLHRPLVRQEPRRRARRTEDPRQQGQRHKDHLEDRKPAGCRQSRRDPRGDLRRDGGPAETSVSRSPPNTYPSYSA